MESPSIFEKTNQYLKEIKPNSRIFISGICGTAMAPLAVLLKNQGYKIAGSDKAFYPPMSNLLQDNNIQSFEGYSTKDIENFKPDFVVIGNSIREDNPQASFVIERGIPYSSQAQMLSEILIGSSSEAKTIVISGTHGKTTTTGITAYLLEKAGYDPGFFIGGYLQDLGRAIKQKSTPEGYCVLEGDEYDTAFFLKQPKFLSYKPRYVVMTSLEFDHADIYDSLEDIEQEFSKLANMLPENGYLLVCEDYPSLKKLAKKWESSCRAKIGFYSSTNNRSDSYIISRTSDMGQKVEASILGEEVQFETALLGEHNAMNILAACHILKASGVELREVLPSIKNFIGPKRRGQVVFENKKVVVIEDFAHHPTAVKTTLNGLKESYKDRKLIALFEPRSNTSRRSFFQDAYKDALALSDYVIIKSVPKEQIYAKSGHVSDFLDVDLICQNIGHDKAFAFDSFEEILESLAQIIKEEEEKIVVAVMSNGDFGGVIPQIGVLLSCPTI